MVRAYDDRGFLQVGSDAPRSPTLEDLYYNLTDWQVDVLQDLSSTGRRCMLEVWDSPSQEGRWSLPDNWED